MMGMNERMNRIVETQHSEVSIYTHSERKHERNEDWPFGHWSNVDNKLLSLGPILIPAVPFSFVVYVVVLLCDHIKYSKNCLLGQRCCAPSSSFGSCVLHFLFMFRELEWEYKMNNIFPSKCLFVIYFLWIFKFMSSF